MSAIVVEKDGPVEIISINDAPRNRMSLAFMDELEAEIDRVRADQDIRAVVIRGAGEENFSVGMDLKQLPEGIQKKGGPDALFDQRLRVLSAIENLGKPVIAINAATYWHALRANGITDQFSGHGPLFESH